jgi:hypothetical protein
MKSRYALVDAIVVLLCGVYANQFFFVAWAAVVMKFMDVP